MSEITKDTEYKLETEVFSVVVRRSSDSLRGQLSATVVRVFNGNMEIMGQKKLALNNGNERKDCVDNSIEDVLTNNIIRLQKIVDTSTYTGAGQTHVQYGLAIKGITRIFTILIEY